MPKAVPATATATGEAWVEEVSEKGVIPVEIYGLCEDNNAAIATHHIQEILEILRECLTSLSINTKRKDNSTKQQQQKSGIITGTNVRIGYVLKKRPGNQICLVPSSYVNDNNDGELRSFQVQPEKVVVYAHKLGSGSPSKMSQLMKKVQDKRQSTGSGVSISSYFKKIGTQSSKNQTGSSSKQQSEQSQPTSSENQSEDSSAHQAPPSEGRRHKIKGILKRVDEKVKRKRKRRPSKPKAEITKVTVFELMSSDDCSDDTVGNQAGKKDSRIKQSTKQNVDKHKSTVSVVDDDTPSDTELAKEWSTESVNTKVDKPVSGSTTNIQDVPLSSRKPADPEIIDSSDRESHSPREPGSACIIGDMRISKVNVPALKLVPSDSDGAGTVTVISVDQMHDIQEDSINMSSDSTVDESVLPTASFCTRPYSDLAQVIDKVYQRIESSDNDTLTEENSSKDSPKFRRNKSAECTQVKDTDDTSRDEVEQCNTDNAEDKPSHKTAKLSRFRFKRKFPTFSESDSDESVLPVKKVTKVCTDKKKGKFVDKDTFSSASGKYYTFPSSFSSENESKKQTKLSFFMNKENISETKPQSKDLDLELIEELSQTPMIKKETDSILKREIDNIDSVKELNEEHICYLVGENKKHLRKIFEGKVKCRRHDMYKQGGNSRRLLNHESRLDHYTDEQVDQVMDILMGMFCKRHHKYLDYVTKVLLPEMLIKLHMDVHGTSHHASDNMLGQSSSQDI